MPQWYYARDRQKLGPFEFAQLQQLAGAGLVQPGDMVLEDGSQQWREARAVPGLLSQSSAPASTVIPLPLPQDANVPKIDVACPHCRHKMTLNETVRGREVRCPQCQQKYLAGASAPMPSPPSVPASPSVESKPSESKSTDNKPSQRKRGGNLVAYQVQRQGDQLTIAVSCSCGSVTKAGFLFGQSDKHITCPYCGRVHRGFELS